MSHMPGSRPKPPPAGNEEATTRLNLGEFQNVDTLTFSEAALVLQALNAKRHAERKNTGEDTTNKTEMLNQTLSYLDNFARFPRKEGVEAVERLLSSHTELHKYERAQLGSLVPAAAEEAKTLIPSLRDKISDEDLQEILNQLSDIQEHSR